MIIGTSSSGKTTLARALQQRLEEPFCYYSSDQLADQGFRSRKDSAEGRSERQRFFDGFHRSIPAFANAGNNLIVDHVVEEQSWADELGKLLATLDVFWVGVHAPIEVLDRREQERGDRKVGEARFHLKTHQYCRYDFEIDSTGLLAETVASVVAAWRVVLEGCPEIERDVSAPRIVTQRQRMSAVAHFYSGPKDTLEGNSGHTPASRIALGLDRRRNSPADAPGPNRSVQRRSGIYAQRPVTPPHSLAGMSI